MKIKLIAKTKNAQNKLDHHGNDWELVEDSEFNGKPAFLIKSKKTQGLRWVLKKDDPQWEIA